MKVTAAILAVVALPASRCRARHGCRDIGCGRNRRPGQETQTSEALPERGDKGLARADAPRRTPAPTGHSSPPCPSPLCWGHPSPSPNPYAEAPTGPLCVWVERPARRSVRRAPHQTRNRYQRGPQESPAWHRMARLERRTSRSAGTAPVRPQNGRPRSVLMIAAPCRRARRIRPSAGGSPQNCRPPRPQTPRRTCVPEVPAGQDPARRR